VLDLLDRLCRHCHALKTRHRWSLVEGQGKRALVPPDDPRHPRNASRQEQPRPPVAVDPRANRPP
jgi:NMD protein affecting ribosome stability and mRNA decay